MSQHSSAAYKQKITVIIPTFNEEETIENVVRFAYGQPNVNEVIVVDDRSVDRTVIIAQQNGAKVITSTRAGKGASMKDGILCASNEIIVFLDGDIDPYPYYTVKLLTDPILYGEAEFVKSSFNRNAGRITEMVAKPLISIFFPGLLRFNQLLSGIVAGKKSLLQQLEFRDDLGVDIGLLIDMHLMNVAMTEVEIGYIENKNRAWKIQGRKSREVAQTIVLKAAAASDELANDPGIAGNAISQMDTALGNQVNGLDKLIVFEMDHTLLQGSFIESCAKSFGFGDKLDLIKNADSDYIVYIKQVAALLKGKTLKELISVADSIPVVKNTKEIITQLKKRGYITGIISESFDVIANYFRNKLGLDFALANELEFNRSVCTGEVKVPYFLFNNPESLCKHSLCKTNALLNVLSRYQIKQENCIVVGDHVHDLCMIKEAGLGVAFCSTDELVNHRADVVIDKPSFRELLHLAK